MPNKLSDASDVAPMNERLDAAGAWAKRYFLASRALMDVILRPYGLGQTQWYVLHLLATAGPLAQRELTTMLEVERATLSAIIGALVRKGLVAQESSTIDQRQKTLSLTAAGRTLWRELPDPLGLIAGVAFDGVRPRDLETANRVLREGTERLETYRQNYRKKN